MQDRTIDNALLALRRQIIHGGGEGLEQVEHLLRLRGVPMPRTQANVARRGQMQHLVLAAVSEGHRTRPAITAYVVEHRADIPPDRAYWRVDAALAKLKRKGKVQDVGRGVWVNSCERQRILQSAPSQPTQ